MLNTLLNSKWIARLIFISTLLSAIATFTNQINPEWGVFLTALSGAISAFVTRVQPTE